MKGRLLPALAGRSAEPTAFHRVLLIPEVFNVEAINASGKNVWTNRSPYRACSLLVTIEHPFASIANKARGSDVTDATPEKYVEDVVWERGCKAGL